MKIKALGIVCVIIVTALVVTSLTPHIDHDMEVSYDIGNVGYVDVVNTDFPSSFDLRDVNGISYVTSVKDQGHMGTCWAFSATSVLETAAISAGLAKDDLDLSEVQYIYFSHKGVSSEGDTLEFHNDHDFINGGYLEESMFNYGQWEGNLTEASVGYTYSELGYNTELDPGLQYLSDSVRLTNAYVVNCNDTDSIKYMLTERHLSAIIGFALNVEDIKKVTIDGKEITTIYNDGTSYIAGHAVALIGYDDDFPASNFNNEKVTQNGAWLCKNSWGTTENNDGMVWIPYQNASFGQSVIFLEAGSADAYDNNYQYDNGKSLMHDRSVGSTGMMANVFTSNGDEVLQATSFYVLRNTEADYTISVYKDLTNSKDPTSGQLVSSASGTTTYSGYYTVDLDDDVYLDAGTKFSIVVSLTSSDGSDIYLPIDTRERVNDEGLYVIYESVAHPGQSYISSDGRSWKDISSDHKSNVRLKAFTSDI